MKIFLKTPVKGTVEEVFSRFDRELFAALKPPMVEVEIKRFDGCRRNDVIHLVLKTPLGKEEWLGEITEDFSSQDQCYFIDKGVKLPFPLSFWKHKHIVTKENNQTVIIDDIEFKASPAFLGPMFYPVLWVMFKYRGPIYQRIFS